MTTTTNNYTADASWTAPDYLLDTTAAGGGNIALRVFGAIGGTDGATLVHPVPQGGRVDGGLAVVSGDVIGVVIGFNGGVGAKVSTYGYGAPSGNGGAGLHPGGNGNGGGEWYGGTKSTGGYGGGGSTGVKKNGTVKIEAAGGGGIGGGGDPAGEAFGYTNGGTGGIAGDLPTAGGDGITTITHMPYSGIPGHGGKGATAVAGGAGGTATSAVWATLATTAGDPGDIYGGGTASAGDNGHNPGGGGGGGGGGKYGGGAGSGGGSNSGGGGGGGGISWVDTDVLNPNLYEGSSTLFGSVQLTFTVADAPLAPTLGLPIDTGFVDVDDMTAVTRLFFTAKPGTDSGAMNAYCLRIKPSSGGYGYWNGTDFSDTSPVWTPCGPADDYADIPNAAFTPGVTYDWSFATQESYFDLQGVFATDQSFTAALSPTLVITAPVDIVSSLTPTATWTGSFPSGNSQNQYRGVVYTAAQAAAPGFVPGDTPFVNDSGIVASASPTFTIGTLPNVDDYVLALYIIDTPDDAPSPWVLQPFSASSGGPATPSIVATGANEMTTGCPVIVISTASSYGSDVHIEVQSSVDQITWVKLRNSEMLTNAAPVTDWECPFNVPVYYRARAIGNMDWASSGAYSVWSGIVNAKVLSNRFWLVDPLNPGPDGSGYLGALPIYRTNSRQGASASGIRLSHQLNREEQQGEFHPFGREDTYLTRGDLYTEHFSLATWFGSLDEWEAFDALRNRRRTLCMKADMPGKVHYMALGPERPRDIYSGVSKNKPDSMSEAIVACISQKKP